MIDYIYNTVKVIRKLGNFIIFLLDYFSWSLLEIPNLSISKTKLQILYFINVYISHISYICFQLIDEKKIVFLCNISSTFLKDYFLDANDDKCIKDTDYQINIQKKNSDIINK